MATQINVQMEFEKLFLKYKYVLKEYNTIINDRHSFQISDEEHGILNQYRKDLNNLYLSIYEVSKNEKIYFYGASFEVFLIYLENLETERSKKDENFSVYDFYKDLYIVESNNLITIPKEFDSLSNNIKIGFSKNISKRLEYLESTMYEMGINITKHQPYPNTPRLNITFENNLERRFEFEKRNVKEEEKEPSHDKKDIPYKIALLNELGFFDLPIVKGLSKPKQRVVIQKLIGGSDRYLEGNMNVLNMHSKEDPFRFTSVSKMADVKLFISSLYK